MNNYDRRVTDQEPVYEIGPWPFILSGLAWGIILGLMWAW